MGTWGLSPTEKRPELEAIHSPPYIGESETQYLHSAIRLMTCTDTTVPCLSMCKVWRSPCFMAFRNVSGVNSPHTCNFHSRVCFIVITALCNKEATKCEANGPTLLPESGAMDLAALLMLKDREAQNSPMVRVSSVVMLVGRKGANVSGNICKMMD